MMPEISLNILDVAQNSVSADATLIEISAEANTQKDRLIITVRDNGRGMTPEQVSRVADPFYTTRTTRRVGLGVPFFKMAAELSGGSFAIDSTLHVGTVTKAEFGLTHIDRMPLGDLAATYVSLVGSNPTLDFVLTMRVDDCSFQADTREFREVMSDISLGEPEVLEFISDFIKENQKSCDPSHLL